jgi:hypothetical protein
LVVLGAIGSLLGVTSVIAQSMSVRPAGVTGRLTTELREQAVKCGLAGESCAVQPYKLCADDGPYIATLITPYSRVALAAMDAERNGQTLRRMGPASVNRWGVAVSVSPSAHSTDPGTIERLEIRRDGRVIQPLKATVGPVTATRSDGTSWPSTRGFFVVPPEAFEPSADIDIRLIGPSGEATCRLNRTRLQALR